MYTSILDKRWTFYHRLLSCKGRENRSYEIALKDNTTHCVTLCEIFCFILNGNLYVYKIKNILFYSSNISFHRLRLIITSLVRAHSIKHTAPQSDIKAELRSPSKHRKTSSDRRYNLCSIPNFVWKRSIKGDILQFSTFYPLKCFKLCVMRNTKN